VVNEQKIRVVKTNAAKFLGFNFREPAPDVIRETKLRWSDGAFADFKHQVRKLTGRSWGVSMAYRFRKLAQYVRGWMGYFGISDSHRPIPDNFAGSEIGRTQCARRVHAMDGA
jgi:RNA-directed DNA polymerase